MTRYVFALGVALLAFTVEASAQTPINVPRGQTFGVEWNSQYPNDPAVRFLIWVDQTQTKLFTSAELTVTTAPVADCPVPAGMPAATTCFLYRGTHPALQNTGPRTVAFGVQDVATSLISTRVTVPIVVGTPPNPVTNPKVVVTTTQAGVTFEFKSAPVTVAQGAQEPQPMTIVKIPVPR